MKQLVHYRKTEYLGLEQGTSVEGCLPTAEVELVPVTVQELADHQQVCVQFALEYLEYLEYLELEQLERLLEVLLVQIRLL